MIDSYLKYLHELSISSNFNNMGFGYENMSNGIKLCFQTKWHVTGSDNAILFIDGLKDINKFNPGDEYPIHFGQTWSLNWNDVIKDINKKGKYNGHGTLNDNNKCDWYFESNIIKMKKDERFHIYNKRSGMFLKNRIVITKETFTRVA